MQLLVTVLACLACSGLGRRVRINAGKSQEDMNAIDQGTLNPAKKLANFLLSGNPDAAFQPSYFPAGNPMRRTRSGKQNMQGTVEIQECDKEEKCVLTDAETGECIKGECVGDRSDSGVSYRAQFEDLFSRPLVVNKPVSKPSPEAQAKEPTAVRVPFSDVYGTKMTRSFFNRNWSKRDIGRLIFFSVVHGAAALVPFFFSWKMLGIHFLLYLFSGLGITYSYHRQLAHKSFKSKKWFEYFWAHCGMMGMQGAPLDWASEHRYHHLHTETPLDPHSIYEGFYWSHMGWLLDSEKKEERCADMSNAQDLSKQPFYRLTNKYYKLYVLAHFATMYALGGVAGLVWRCFFIVLQYHITWFVNSASHVWGNQEYRTGDQSRNNWWVGILAFGEGWHNNHHAFEYSARHGLRKHQFDSTWLLIKLFQKMGLVSGVKLPTQRNMDRLRLKEVA